MDHLFGFDLSFFTILAVVGYALGATAAVFAIWRSRTPQGATAWAVGLISFPFAVLPLFLVFGHSKFVGYARRRKDFDDRARKEVAEVDALFARQFEPGGALDPIASVLRAMPQPGFTRGNHFELLIDAEETYARFFEAIAAAKTYLLFEFYTFRSDSTGYRFADALCAAARRGVRVYVLYDKIGARPARALLRRLELAGVEVAAFERRRRLSLTRLQINFRNHRKILIADGRVGFVGGLNIGDEYLGLDDTIGAWRDTHARIEGPAVLAAQFAFLKDWYWARREIVDLDWTPRDHSDACDALVLHTGPADEAEWALLATLALISSAERRIWIANPYFVPPEGLLNALSLAALRGIDVRVLVPARSDNRFVDLASEVYQEKLLRFGARVFYYTKGFTHQKVILIDDSIASVASTNLDSRSLFINFEVGAITNQPTFVAAVSAMLANDFASSREVTAADCARRSKARKFLSRAIGLASPML